MIRYSLVCHKKHEFESWFGSSTAFDRLARKGQVECPQCGSTKVTKALMAPQVATRRSRSAKPEAEAASTAPVPAPSPEAVQQMEAQRQLLGMMRELRREVADKAEYVGPKFAEEARKIHHKEAEARGIWGEATLAEARELSEDGIDCLPLPRLPEDGN